MRRERQNCKQSYSLLVFHAFTLLFHHNTGTLQCGCVWARGGGGGGEEKGQAIATFGVTFPSVETGQEELG